MLNTDSFIGNYRIISQLSNRPFTSQEVAAFISAIGQALAYAHQRHITHRQLTPERVLLDDVTNMAKLELQLDGSALLGQGYEVDGNILSFPQQFPTTLDNVGMFLVKVDSIWIYQFSDAQIQHLSQLIASQAQGGAADVLRRQRGVSQVHITTSGIGMALPSSVQDIKFTITAVREL